MSFLMSYEEVIDSIQIEGMPEDWVHRAIWNAALENINILIDEDGFVGEKPLATVEDVQKGIERLKVHMPDPVPDKT